jgi:membrane protein DedA with SNARE-associated domain
MLEHATWFLFAWVFCNQAGVPVPVVPALLGVGTLARDGHLSLAVIIGITVGASLAADLTWYGLGRWRGDRALKVLGRLAPHAGMLVRRARRVFAAHVRTFQIGARFLPELNAIASGLAGVTKRSITRFVCYGALSSLAWAGAWIGLGYFLSNALTETAVRLGIRLIVPFVAAFAFYLPFQRIRRHRLIRAFRRGPLRSNDFKGRLNSAARVTILGAQATDGREVRSLGAPGSVLDHYRPGAAMIEDNGRTLACVASGGARVQIQAD